MNKFFELGEKLNIEKIAKVLFENQKLRLSKTVESKISKSRSFLEKKISINYNMSPN